MTERICGGCTACCFTHEIKAIRKPLGTWCTHAVGGGCSIYNTKPSACTKYRCAWLKGVGSEKDRPDKVNAVFDLIEYDPFSRNKVLEVLEIEEGASLQSRLQTIIMDHLRSGANVFVSASGKEESLYALAENNTLPRDKRRIFKKNKVIVTTAAEYAAKQKTPAE